MFALMRRHRHIWLFVVVMLAGMALAALIAISITRPKPPGPAGVHLAYCETTSDPLALWLSRADFTIDGKKHTVNLGWPLLDPPATEHDWHLAEVNPSPGASYCVLESSKTRERVVVWQDGDKPRATRPPIAFPLPLWPGVGCVGVIPNQRTMGGQNELVAQLTGGAYTYDSLLGQFRVGDVLPKPWNRWRVKELIANLTPPRRFKPGYIGEFACVIVNEDTGQTVRLPAKQMIDMRHDAPLVMPTTQPATQPAK